MKSEELLKGAIGIEAGTYANRMDLFDVKLEKNIEYIGENAFYNCRNLRYVEVPATCTRIGANAFGKCENLKWIQFSVHGKRIKIHPRAFVKSGLKEIKLPATCIGTNPFEMGMFRGVLYPSYYSMKGLYKYPFERERIAGEKAEQEIYVYYDNDREGYFVAKIEGNWMDRRLVLPEKIDDQFIVGIAKEAFKGWDFESVILPFTCRFIEESAFENCNQLQHVGVYFNPKEMHIHPRAFRNCTRLNGITYYDVKKMSECDEWVEVPVEELELVNGREGYELWAFHGKADYIKLPEIIEINPNAFAHSHIKGIEIPKSCKTICYEAFDGCLDLEEVILSKETRVGQYAFKNCPKVKLIYRNEE